ncbi:MAG: Ig domain-containing protein [Bacteroidetes bacterium]|nr:Ig domain-containing protein [Candidatus Colenecus caballi]
MKRLFAIAVALLMAAPVPATDDDRVLVDLGLSVKWAAANVQCGDTATLFGFQADVPLEEPWRTPSWQEWRELLANCTWKFIESDSVTGYLVTSHVPGFKGNSIFLPFEGWQNDEGVHQTEDVGCYWSSTPIPSPDNHSGFAVYMIWSGHYIWPQSKSLSLSVRPVSEVTRSDVKKFRLKTGSMTLHEGAHGIIGLESDRVLDALCTWESSDTTVAVVEYGSVLARSAGRCTITVTCAGHTRKCRVTVLPGIFESVDLGLPFRIATMNVGAQRPQDWGDSFVWSETWTKDFYSWNTFMWGSREGIFNYRTDNWSTGRSRPKRLTPDDDIARVAWGPEWRMPARMECELLADACDAVADTLCGIPGIRLVSMVPGFEDRSVFFPASGVMDGNGPAGRGEMCRILTSEDGACLNLNKCSLFSNSDTRYLGVPVRAVTALQENDFETVVMDTSDLVMLSGTKTCVTAKVIPSRICLNDMFSWSSSDESIAIADVNGVIKALSAGTCEIIAGAGGREARCRVTVIPQEIHPVDLGLSVLWADVNLGELSPGYGSEESGYFTRSELPRLLASVPEGWRLPTWDEVQELISSCNVALHDFRDAVPVVRFTSKSHGHESDTLLIPFLGSMDPWLYYYDNPYSLEDAGRDETMYHVSDSGKAACYSEWRGEKSLTLEESGDMAFPVRLVRNRDSPCATGTVPVVQGASLLCN